ncbi:MAG: hypothetical protein J7L40_00090 [Candidatus Marinimicrobia bacterium]|nr:hypothetical protein [Candidatus Neomarinimicrobiota bacterium]
MNKKRRYTPRRNPGILLIIIIISMIITNPSKDDFFEWINNQAIEASESSLESVLTNMIVTPLLRSVTVRKDYVLFSTYTIEFDEDKTAFLGIFKNFIEL